MRIVAYDDSEEGIPRVGERAVNYMKNLWASVLKWCRDGRYSLDNNLAYPKVWITSPNAAPGRWP